MKANPWIVVALCGLPVCSVLADEVRKGGIGMEVLPSRLTAPVRDVSDDESLLARRTERGTRALKVVARRNTGFGFLELSQFIGNGSTSTVLPKGAVLFCPDQWSSRLLSAPDGRIVPLAEFVAANRNWIALHEVSPAQVRGEVPIPDGEREAFAVHGKLVIATIAANPVSVLPSNSNSPQKP
ncbi:hypothetical protein [Luteolibacter marinus]|uniref:hypothetical protein n=1 Tax=Luteolibacter marinus TaxID=2776705 RepID=UPI001865C0AF|nr:hypothetical protein [Luteolibacter marinus]